MLENCSRGAAACPARHARMHGISISQKKFVFAKQEIKYVGYIVNGEGFKADPDKIKAIRDFPQPTNLTEIRSFFLQGCRNDMYLGKQFIRYSIIRLLMVRPGIPDIVDYIIDYCCNE